MFQFLRKFFARFKKTAEQPKQNTFIETAPDLSEIQLKVQEKISNNITRLLIRDNNEEYITECKSMLEMRGYFIYYINMNENNGPFNIFHNMTEKNYGKYVDLLSLDNKSTRVQNLNSLLLTSVLLSMVEAQELTWNGFTQRMNNIERDKPEFITAAVDEKIKQAFQSFKEMVKGINLFVNEFKIFNDDKYQKAESYIPDGKIAVFYKEFQGDEAFLNKAILFEFDEKGIL